MYGGRLSKAVNKKGATEFIPRFSLRLRKVLAERSIHTLQSNQ